MDDLFSKYKELLIKNEKLVINLEKQKTLNTLLQQEITSLKNTTSKPPHISTTNPGNNNIPDPDTQNYQKILKEQEVQFKKYFIKNKKYVLGLLGYDIEIFNDRIELLSLYSFHPNDKFIFTIENNSLNLLSNEMTEVYKKEVQDYMAIGKSIPAFLAHVTLDLKNKKTFQ